MNEFFNPKNTFSFLKTFFFDPKRLKNFSKEKMERYRNKAFRKTIEYAYTVPLYHKKYRKAGVHPKDIKGFKDIEKLPFVTKKDLREASLEEIISKGAKKENKYVVCTSGSTGKPVNFFTDFQTLSKSIGIYLRELEIFDLHWRKSKVAHIGNFSKDKADSAFEEGFVSKTRVFYNHSNSLSINNFEPIDKIMKKLDSFKPDLILSYPVTFKNLAFLKNKGYGKNVNPQVLAVGGYVLDEYTKKYVEDAFNCKMLNVYSSAESGADIAFECFDDTWHVNHDFFHVESIDEQRTPVDDKTSGHVVLTRMFGQGTPIVRYTGMDDWVTIEEDYNCSCGLNTPILKGGIKGRMSTSVILPDGRVYPSASFAFISVILNKFNTKKVKQFQIIQNKIDDIEILLVIDEVLRDKPPAVDKIFNKIKEKYQEICGENVNIKVREVDEIKSERGKPSPLVISKIDTEEAYKKIL